MKIYFRTELKGIEKQVHAVIPEQVIDLAHVRNNTRPAAAHEFKDLLNELQQAYKGQTIEPRTHFHTEVKKALNLKSNDLANFWNYGSNLSYQNARAKKSKEDLFDKFFHQFILNIK